MADQQFAIQAGALRVAVAMASAVTERRNTIPILSHVHLHAQAGQLTVMGCDMQSWITASGRGDGDLAPVTASAARLNGLLALLAAEETVTLSQAKVGHLALSAGSMNAKLFTLPAEEFPGLPSRSWTKRWAIPAGKLRDLFDRTVHAVSTEETRYYLNGVFLHVNGQGPDRKFHAAATDGHRLMVASDDLPQGDEPASLIVPRQIAGVLRGFLSRCTPEHVIRARSTDAILDIDGPGWGVVAKMIDGTYPDFWRLIPPDLTGEPLKVLNARRFADAIRTTRSISTERSQPIRIGNGMGHAVRIDARSGEGDECEFALPEDVAAWGSNGDHPAVGFQARYILDLCGVFRTGFELRADGDGPSRISGPEGIAVLMPMRV